MRVRVFDSKAAATAKVRDGTRFGILTLSAQCGPILVEFEQDLENAKPGVDGDAAVDSAKAKAALEKKFGPC